MSGQALAAGGEGEAQTTSDFDKSITLNWCFNRPAEFAHDRYDFTSEVYFVGKLPSAILAVAAFACARSRR